VLLAGVVTYFAINVTSTRVQQESLSLMKTHIWYAQSSNGTYVSQAALLVVNTGGRDVVLQKVTVRGQTVPWADLFFSVTGQSIASDLAFNTTSTTSGATTLTEETIGSTAFALSSATTDVTLPSGQTMILYITNPDSITVNDIGLTVGVTVFTSQAMYYQEANVQSS